MELNIDRRCQYCCYYVEWYIPLRWFSFTPVVTLNIQYWQMWWYTLSLRHCYIFCIEFKKKKQARWKRHISIQDQCAGQRKHHDRWPAAWTYDLPRWVAIFHDDIYQSLRFTWPGKVVENSCLLRSWMYALKIHQILKQSVG